MSHVPVHVVRCQAHDAEWPARGPCLMPRLCSSTCPLFVTLSLWHVSVPSFFLPNFQSLPCARITWGTSFLGKEGEMLSRQWEHTLLCLWMSFYLPLCSSSIDHRQLQSLVAHMQCGELMYTIRSLLADRMADTKEKQGRAMSQLPQKSLYRQLLFLKCILCPKGFDVGEYHIT